MKSTSLKVGWIIITLAIGFIFPPALIVTVFLVFNVIAALKTTTTIDQLKTKQPKHSERLKNISSDENGWADEFRAVCESPAEIAFLNVMLKAFALKPKSGRLVGHDLTLQMQIPVGSYRLDFLGNKNLIVEVDGSEWHSSKEAIKRDNVRDMYMEENRFFALRIPAKITLYEPYTAIRMVKDAIPLASKIYISEKEALREECADKNNKILEIRRSLLRPGFYLESVSLAINDAEMTLAESNRQAEIKVSAKRLREQGVLTPESYFRERASLLRSIASVVDLNLESQALEIRHSSSKDRADTLGIEQNSKDILRKRLQDSWSLLRKNSEIIPLKMILEDIDDIDGIYDRFESVVFGDEETTSHSNPEAIAEYSSRYISSAKYFSSHIGSSMERRRFFVETCSLSP